MRASFEDGEWVLASQPIEIWLDAPVLPDEGRLAVLIDRTDWTGLFEVTAQRLRYASTRVPLPRGESRLSVHVVSARGDWRQIGELPLRVLHAGGFERIESTPAIEISSQGQAAFSRSPAVLPTDRGRFQDAKLTLGAVATLARNGVTTRSQVNILGASNPEEALRFATEGPDAPEVDLADYLLDIEHRRARVSVGHVQWNAQRHLVSAFATRGLSAGVKLAPGVDVSLHAMNGTSIVGWSNVLGLDRRSHQVRGATLGLELRPSRPGALRLAVSWLDGSVQPLTGFTAAAVNDAETSRGAALRVTATDAAARLQIDGGYARSRFRNPADPLLEQTLSTVPVRETSRNARYLDVSYVVLPKQSERQALHLTAAVRHSLVDPLYRSVAAVDVLADRREDTLELGGGIGPYASLATWTDGRDNTDGVPSLLTTRTRTLAWTHALPLADLRSSAGAWLPRLSLALNWQHQFADGMPTGSFFNSPTQLPDQLNTIQTVSLDWIGERWRATYTLNRSHQDNRQLERERSDFRTLVHTVGLGVAPGQNLDVSVDLSFEGAYSRESDTTDTTRRLGLTGTWRAAAKTTVTAFASATLTGNDPQTRDGRATDVHVQFGQSLGFLERRPDWLRAQLFVRAAWQTERTTDLLFGLADRQRSWALSTGLTFRVF